MDLFGTSQWKTTNQRNNQKVLQNVTTGQNLNQQQLTFAKQKAQLKGEFGKTGFANNAGASICLQAPGQGNPWQTSSSAVGKHDYKPGFSDFNKKMMQQSDDNNKLCFTAYFEEAVQESFYNEQQRVRSVRIFFYLLDDTIEIFEPKNQNSGMTQGKFLQRSQVARPGNDRDPYKSYDIVLGNSIKVHGQSFKIVSCNDDFTQRWYDDQHPAEDCGDENLFEGYLATSNKNFAATNANMSVPVDTYTATRREMALRSGHGGSNAVVNYGRKSRINQLHQKGTALQKAGVRVAGSNPAARATTRPF